MRYSYYPGCTLHSTGAEYGASAKAVFSALDVELAEIEDWSCCGATSGHSTSSDLAVLLAGRNLALAQEAQRDVLVPCAACYSRLRHANHALSEDEGLRQKLVSVMGTPWTGTVEVESALDVVAGRVPAEAIESRVKRPLSGLKTVAYYGCLLARPHALTGESNPDHPTTLDRVLATLGADVVDWSYKTDCCGAGLSLTYSDQVVRLVGRLIEEATEAGAECIATACPMCQANLEMRQRPNQKMPVFYFTELMGLAFGLSDAGKWWGKHLVDPRPVLGRL